MQKTWHYKKWDSKVALNLFFLALTLYSIQWLGNAVFGVWWLEIVFFFGIMLFFLTWAIPVQWVESYQVTEDAIIIQHRFKKTKRLPFSGIKRLIFQKRNDPILGAIIELKISVEGSTKSKKIIVSALEDHSSFIGAIEQKSDRVKIIHQTESGEVVASVEKV